MQKIPIKMFCVNAVDAAGILLEATIQEMPKYTILLILFLLEPKGDEW